MRRLNGRGFGGVTPASGRSEPIAIIQTMKEKIMSFGLNRAEVIGRLGADVTVNHLASGGRVASLSVATDESYIDRKSRVS